MQLLVATGPRALAHPWENLPLRPPPTIEHAWAEIALLRRMETALVHSPLRQREMLAQVSSAEIAEVLIPLGVDPDSHPETVALIGVVMALCEVVGYVYKRKFSRLRPNQLDPSLRPFLPVPWHHAYNSNHAFQLFAVAEVITRILPEFPGTLELFHVAQRVAENREHGGVHYPSDTVAGRELARLFSPYLFYACRRQMRAAFKEWL